MAMEEGAKREEIHILLVAFAAQGHLNPMLRLSQRFLSKGLHVTFATTDVARHRMLSSTSSSSVAGINLRFFSDGLSLDYDRKSNMDHYMDSLSRFGPPNLSTIIHSHPHRFSCIVNNPFVPWVSLLAGKLGIPCAMLWIQPSSLYSLYYRFYTSPEETPNLTAVQLPGLPLLDTQDLPSFLLPSNTIRSFPKLLSELFRDMTNLRWVFCNSFLELEKDAIDSMSELRPIIPVGPLVPPVLLGQEDGDVRIEMYRSEDGCIEWLDQQEPKSVVYISFGSIVVLSEKQMESIAVGLKNSKCPFLWVMKPPDTPNKDGDRKLPLGFHEETKERGLIVEWSPQVKVLSHPSVACFLSHCGWNSLLETISAGVPVIAYPQWTDQPTNAKLVTDVFRVGVRLHLDKDGTITSEEVEKCIEKVIRGPSSDEFRRNASKLKQAAREAVSEGGSSDQNIELFINDIIGINSCARN